MSITNSTIKQITRSGIAALVLGAGPASSTTIDTWNLDNDDVDPGPYIALERPIK